MSAIELWAVCKNSILGGDGLGEKGKQAEEVGKECALSLIEQVRSGAAVDKYAEDQLIPYMALAVEKGKSEIKVPKLTDHTKTNIWVVEKFLPVRFETKDNVIGCRKI